MRKVILVAGGLLLLLVILIAFRGGDDEPLAQPVPEAPGPVDQTASGTVTAVNLDQMALDGPALVVLEVSRGDEQVIAVPSMGILLCAAYNRMASVADIAVGDSVSVLGRENDNGELVPCDSAEHFLEVTGHHEDPVLGYRFSYRKGPDGYVLIEDEETGDAPLLSSLTLFNRAEFEEFQNSSDAREGPPSIRLQVIDNTQKLWPAVWAMRNPELSNHELALAEPAEAVVGGANAVQFVADGLWPIETWVVASDNKIFLLQGTGPDDPEGLTADFRELVGSFEFIRPLGFQESE